MRIHLESNHLQLFQLRTVQVFILKKFVFSWKKFRLKNRIPEMRLVGRLHPVRPNSAPLWNATLWFSLSRTVTWSTCARPAEKNHGFSTSNVVSYRVCKTRCRIWPLRRPFTRYVTRRSHDVLDDWSCFFYYIQTDIAGHCESNYTVLNQANKGVTISRTKNLLACTGRNSHSSPIQATPYSSTSSIQSIPLLRWIDISSWSTWKASN